MLTDIWFTTGYTFANFWLSPGLGPGHTLLLKNKLRAYQPNLRKQIPWTIPNIPEKTPSWAALTHIASQPHPGPASGAVWRARVALSLKKVEHPEHRECSI